jgi:putative FmdB family regulatory protein
MKLYQYQCRKCAHSFKRVFLILPDAPFACPKCGDTGSKRALNYATLTPESGIDRTESEAEYGPRIKPGLRARIANVTSL